MAILHCKGTTLKREISSVMTAVAQVISMDLPEAEAETFEADHLGNTDAGILYLPTGRTEGGEFGCELFLDPALSGHKQYTADLEDPWTRLNPSAAGVGVPHSVTFTDSTPTVWTFNVVGVTLGATVALNDGLKANLTLKLNGTVNYPS